MRRFFIAGEHQPDLPFPVIAGHEGLDGEKCNDDAALAVEHAGAVQAVAFLAEQDGPAPRRVHGIEVGEKRHGLFLPGSGVRGKGVPGVGVMLLPARHAHGVAVGVEVAGKAAYGLFIGGGGFHFHKIL